MLKGAKIYYYEETDNENKNMGNINSLDILIFGEFDTGRKPLKLYSIFKRVQAFQST